VGRLLLLLGACGSAACGNSGPADAAPADAAPFALPIAEAVPIDAAPEADAESIAPTDVLSGGAAEQAIASGKTVEGSLEDKRAPAAPAADAPAYLIGPDTVGPFRLGAARADVIQQLAGRAHLQRVPTPVGEPTVEVATLAGATGRPLVRLRLYAGRLQELHVVARDRRAVTDMGLGVGATFGEAIATYGEPRIVRESRSNRRLGFVLEDLAGVVLVPADPGALILSVPKPPTRIARILVLGPEATAEED
jgi:hypothetical protein